MKKLLALLFALAIGFSAPYAEAQFQNARPPRRPGPINPLFVPPMDSGQDFVGGDEHDGRHIRVNLPKSEHLRNKAGTDGTGCCVFASLDMDARYQEVLPLIGILDFAAARKGGGWPKKVDEYISQKSNGETVRYQQSTTADEKLFEMFLKTGRPVCMTYGYSPRYKDAQNRDGRIDHMVLCVHLDEKWGVVLDNNFPDTYEWCSRRELFRRWELGDLGGWLVGLLDPPPPPRPK